MKPRASSPPKPVPGPPGAPTSPEAVGDLHLHSSFSDGTYSPEEMVQQAVRHGLSAIALTDHDTLEGCPRARAACEQAGLDFIPGVELAALIDDREVHLLGYGVDPAHPALRRQMEECQRVRVERIHEMVSRLNGIGVPLPIEAVLQLANCRSPGRPHLARALVHAGICRSMEEAFDRFLKRGKPAWVPKSKMAALTGLELIHEAGGAAVMAHPAIHQVDHAIPELARAGLDGLECYHTKHSNCAVRHYLALAQEHHLLITGGSDCHGLSKGRPLIGSVRLPYSHIQALKDRIQRYRTEGACAEPNRHVYGTV